MASLTLALVLSLCTQLSEPAAPQLVATPQADLARAELFPLRDIRLNGGPLGEQQELNRQYLLKLEPDRLLSWFRREAGLDPKAPPYRGWESEPPTLPGHILGFYMSGASMTYQATGDEELRRRLEYIVGELAAVQAGHGSGYMLATPGGKDLFRDVAAGRIEVDGLPWNGYRINGQFEPTYTMNKLMLGLYQIHLATGSPQARQVLLRLCDWFGEEVVEKLNDEQVQTLVNCEHGSLPESYVDAYSLTGDEKYLKWARRLCHERMLQPLARGDVDFMTHFHANSNIPKFTGFNRVYAYTGEADLHAAAVNFWTDVVNRRSWVIGGNSAAEHFFDPAEFERALHVPAGPESCNSVNMLRLTESLYLQDPTADKIDYYERVLLNHILSSHDPERGMCVYYTPLRPGAYRVYSDEFDSMWCCVGTGLEAPGKYAQMIYARSPDDAALTVNLFTPSTLAWRARGIEVEQTTDFPREEATTLTVTPEQPGTRFTLRVRRPRWVAADGFRVMVNDQPIELDSHLDAYAEIDRAWNPGDQIRVELPMRIAAEPLPGSDRYAAFVYGPLVLAGAHGRGELAKDDFWQLNRTIGAKPAPESDLPGFVADDLVGVAAHVASVAGQPLTFRAEGLIGDAAVSLIPLYQNHFQRYTVYWRRYNPGEHEREQAELAARREAERAIDERTLDRVAIGDDRSEREHGLQGERTESGPGAYGSRPETRWRHATSGGWFAYRLAPPTDADAVLRCTYWGRESGPRKFDVLIDGERVATHSLGDAGVDDFVHEEIPLPRDLTAGKPSITVRFEPRPGNTAGGLFDLRIVRPK